MGLGCLTKKVLCKFVEDYVVSAKCERYNPNAGNSASRHQSEQSIDQQIYDAWQRNQCNLGWTLSDERQIFDSLTWKGQFPPDEDMMEEDWQTIYDELLPYCVQDPDSQKENNLAGLVRRFLIESATLSCLISPKDLDDKGVEALRAAQKPGTAHHTSDSTDPLFVHIQKKYSDVYTQEDKGAVYVAMRVALAYLLHGQISLDILKEVKEFSAVVGKDGAAGQVETDYMLASCLRSASRLQNKAHPVNLCPGARGYSRHAKSKATIQEMVALSKDAPYPARNPFEDFCNIVVAHFFDETYENMFRELTTKCHEIQLCSPAYAPMSYHLGPLFVRQDSAHMLRYGKANPTDHFSFRFLPELDGLEPQQYRNQNGKLFDVTDDAAKAVSTINRLQKVGYKDKAKLLSSIIKANELPDTIGAFENSSQAGDFDQESLNYVCKRHISCAVHKTRDDILLSGHGHM